VKHSFSSLILFVAMVFGRSKMAHLGVGLCSLLTVLVGAGCAHTISLESEPAGAVVYSVDAKGAHLQLLGETPLELSSSQLQGQGILSLSRPGFVSKHVAVPAIPGVTTRISVPLEKVSDSWLEETVVSPAHAGVLNRALRNLFELQGHIVRKRLPEAERLIESLSKSYAQISLFHSLVGNFHYLSGEPARARESYQRALDLDPENAEALQMMGVLKKTRATP
jgi:tetratricopeptide (TPR) repeat protein